MLRRVVILMSSVENDLTFVVELAPPLSLTERAKQFTSVDLGESKQDLEI